MKKRLAAVKNIKRPEDSEDDLYYSFDDLHTTFIHLKTIKADIKGIDQSKIDRITSRLKYELMASKPQLWAAIKDKNHIQIKLLTETDSLDSIVRPIISDVLYDDPNPWSVSGRDELVLNIVNQAYTAWPYGYIKVNLQKMQVNNYMGHDTLDELNSKVLASLAK